MRDMNKVPQPVAPDPAHGNRAAKEASQAKMVLPATERVNTQRRHEFANLRLRAPYI